MRQNWIRALPLLGLLAACGTPQEQCIRRETAELRQVDRLIADLRVDLERGYSTELRPFTTRVWKVCSVSKDAEGNVISSNWCWDRETTYRRVPVAIDPAAERRKLAGLERRRDDLAGDAARAVAACRATYPE